MLQGIVQIAGFGACPRGSGQVSHLKILGKLSDFRAVAVITQVNMDPGRIGILHVQAAMKGFVEQCPAFIVSRHKHIHLRPDLAFPGFRQGVGGPSADNLIVQNGIRNVHRLTCKKQHGEDNSRYPLPGRYCEQNPPEQIQQ